MTHRAAKTATRHGEALVGRAGELAALVSAVEHGPQVVFVHGIAGIGKSALLAAFAERARDRRIAVVRIDCASTEPTVRGFLMELGVAIGTEVATIEEAARRLGALGRVVVLAL